MESLNNYNLVYFPVGMEPFREMLPNTRTAVISQVSAHVEAIRLRVEEDVSQTSVARRKLVALRGVSEVILKVAKQQLNAADTREQPSYGVGRCGSGFLENLASGISKDMLWSDKLIYWTRLIRSLVTLQSIYN